jgi:hypothetical protein
MYIPETSDSFTKFPSSALQKDDFYIYNMFIISIL